MSIWHKSVENLLVISAEEGEKMPLGGCAQCPGSAPSCPGGGLWLVPALGRPLQHKCSQWQGGCLSVSVRDHVAKGPCLRRERLPPRHSEESQDTAGGSSSWYALVLI